MTIDVDADYFRKHWVKCSASTKHNEATSLSRIGRPVDDQHYAEMQARIQRLHESFDAWCGTIPEAHAMVSIEQGFAELEGRC